MISNDILVVGGDGFVGKHIVLHCKRVTQRRCDFTSRRETEGSLPFDLTDVTPLSCSRFHEYALIFWAAGMPGFAVCERNPLAYRINVDAPILFAHNMAPHQKLIFLSSDSVEFGLHTHYAQHKALAELGLLACRNTIIARLCRVSVQNQTAVCAKLMEASCKEPPAIVYIEEA